MPVDYNSKYFAARRARYNRCRTVLYIAALAASAARPPPRPRLAPTIDFRLETIDFQGVSARVPEGCPLSVRIAVGRKTQVRARLAYGLTPHRGRAAPWAHPTVVGLPHGLTPQHLCRREETFRDSPGGAR